MKKRILVTGFLPFSSHQTNISQQIVELISVEEKFRYQVDTAILSVDEKGSKEIANRILSGDKIDSILHLGYSKNAKEIHMERFARNRFNMEIADNSGRLLTSGTICKGNRILETNVPRGHIDSHLEKISKIRWNEDAGGFVCNETYYRSLLAAANARDFPKILFIHLPGTEIIQLEEQFEIITKVCDSLESISEV